jgi:Leucine-rich repeat (LRR) protein
MILKGPCNVVFGFNEIKLHSIKIKSFQPDAEFLFENLERLIIENSDNMKIQDMSSIIQRFQSINVKNKIGFIELGVTLKENFDFSSVKNYNIKSMNVLSNSHDFGKVNIDTLRHLEQLEIRSMGRQKANSIHPLSKYRSLKALRIHTKITQTYLNKNKKRFEHLKELELDWNGLKTLDTSSLNQFNQVENLCIISNDFKSFAPKTFPNMKRLVKLVIEFNHTMEKIPKNTFLGLENLKALKIIGGELKTIESGAFNGIDQLQTLELSDNEINSITPDAFVNLINLDLLDLTGNQLVKVETQCSPRVFKASRNKLESILFSADDLSRLEEVDLGENKLKEVNTKIMFCKKETHIKHLDLNWNKFTRLEEACLSNMKELIRLNLHFNHLDQISVEAFTGLMNLEDLELTVPKLDLLSNGLFQPLIGLKVLKIDYIEPEGNSNTEISSFIS